LASEEYRVARAVALVVRLARVVVLVAREDRMVDQDSRTLRTRMGDDDDGPTNTKKKNSAGFIDAATR
jgi:hypothetical protein